jgi:hypothetical protein
MHLPRPDASRLVPRVLRPAAENVLCESAEVTSEVDGWALGPLTLVLVSGEPTADVAAHWERAAGAQRILGLANGYWGYVDTSARVAQGMGEARRQYFGPDLEETLAAAAVKATSPF